MVTSAGGPDANVTMTRWFVTRICALCTWGQPQRVVLNDAQGENGFSHNSEYSIREPDIQCNLSGLQTVCRKAYSMPTQGQTRAVQRAPR